MLFGARTIFFEGNLCLTDEENGLKAYVFFNKEGSSFDNLAGKIYRYNPKGKK